MSNRTPKINIHAIRIGYYTDKYFLRTQEILMKNNYNGSVDYQYFPRKNNVMICGIPQVIQLFKECTGYYDDRKLAWKLFQKMQSIDLYDPNIDLSDFSEFYDLRETLNRMWQPRFNDIELYTIQEGTVVNEFDIVVGVKGNPAFFAHLETPTLGILAQQSAVATSVYEAKKRLTPEQNLLFFPARFRHYASQAPDGYASGIGGGNLMSTDANGEYWGYDGIGTIPHLLIAAYNGDTVKAAEMFDETIDPKVSRIVLVDWDNDCIGTSIKVVAKFLYNYLIKTRPFTDEELAVVNSLYEKHPANFIRCNRESIENVIGLGKGKIFGVRFDTSGSLVDKSLPRTPELKGVCPYLVFLARQRFNELGMHNLKIVVSGGFDNSKLDTFNSLSIPFDMVGIGSSIVNKYSCDFTADAVTLNGKPNAKVGRELGNWGKLTRIT